MSTNIYPLAFIPGAYPPAGPNNAYGIDRSAILPVLTFLSSAIVLSRFWHAGWSQHGPVGRYGHDACLLL